MNIKKNILRNVMAAGLAASAAPQLVLAETINFDWNGVITVMDAFGWAIENSSIPTGPGHPPANRYQTPVSGTLLLDTSTGAGSATIASFGLLFEQTSVSDFQLQAIGDGMGNTGPLMLGNLLLHWGANSGIPVSMVFDASGLFGELFSYQGFTNGQVIAGVGAIPATDGTYVGTNVPGAPSTNGGNLELGPTPIASTAWNTSFAPGCVLNNCMSVVPSGALPLVLDTVENQADTVQNTGAPTGSWGGPDGEVYGVAGSPMVDGPIKDFNIALDITSLTLSPVCGGGGVCEVPVPAAVWLFGSGLMGLIGFARRRS